jgi:hypothetical protein
MLEKLRARGGADNVIDVE